jgi:hypothetical protein
MNILKNGANMKKISMLALGLLLVGATGASAARNYGMAGCGLGSIVMGKSGNQILAGTTNGTYYNQLFAITSGTSNCAEDGVALAEKEKQYFVEANIESLMQEMAQGSGENLSAMAGLYGCSSEAFGVSMHAHYGNLFPSADVDSEALLSNVDKVIEADADLQKSCTELN